MLKVTSVVRLRCGGCFLALWLLALASALAQPATNSAGAETNSFRDRFRFPHDPRKPRAHDPSTIVKCKDRYWVFHTGVGVSSYSSTNLVDWELGPRVFRAAPDWVAAAVPENRNSHFWAPDVIEMNGQFFLYYSVSSFGKNTSAIALATNPTLDSADPDFKWTDRGIVVRSFSTNDFNAIDPAVMRDSDGRLWMSFGSFWSGIKLIELDPRTGLRIAAESPMHSLARTAEIEAPFIHQHDGAYYLFLNWGICCRGTNSTYEIRVGRSDRITGPYRDANNVDMLAGGGTLVINSHSPFIGPGHAGIFSENGTNWFSCHFYDGERRGTPTMSLHELTWENGWPKVKR